MLIVYRPMTTSLYFHGLKPVFLINSMGLSLSSCFPIALAAASASVAHIVTHHQASRRTGDKRFLYPVVPLTGVLFGSLICLGRCSDFRSRSLSSLPIELGIASSAYALFAGVGISMFGAYSYYLYETRGQKSDELPPSS